MTDEKGNKTLAENLVAMFVSTVLANGSGFTINDAWTYWEEEWKDDLVEVLLDSTKEMIDNHRATHDRSILYWVRMRLDGTVVQRGVREFDGSLWALGIAVIPPKTSPLCGGVWLWETGAGRPRSGVYRRETRSSGATSQAVIRFGRIGPSGVYSSERSNTTRSLS